MLQALDSNDDGVVDFGEFCRFFRMASGEVTAQSLTRFWLKSTINVDMDALGVPPCTLTWCSSSAGGGREEVGVRVLTRPLIRAP